MPKPPPLKRTLPPQRQPAPGPEKTQEALQAGDEDLLKVSDFSSAKIHITLQNTTTKTAARAEPPIMVAEFLERGLVLEVPSRSCSAGHAVLIVAEVTLPNGTHFVFEATAKVDKHEPIPNSDTDQISVIMLQFDEGDWEKLQNAFGARQNEIEDFFNSARGY